MGVMCRLYECMCVCMGRSTFVRSVTDAVFLATCQSFCVESVSDYITLQFESFETENLRQSSSPLYTPSVVVVTDAVLFGGSRSKWSSAAPGIQHPSRIHLPLAWFKRLLLLLLPSGTCCLSPAASVCTPYSKRLSMLNQLDEHLRPRLRNIV